MLDGKHVLSDGAIEKTTTNTDLFFFFFFFFFPHFLYLADKLIE